MQGIINAELSRVSSRAVVDGLLAGMVIGLPPVLNYGSPELYEKVVPDVCPLMLFPQYSCLMFSNRSWQEKSMLHLPLVKHSQEAM